MPCGQVEISSMLLAAFPLNRFCNTLPKKLLIQEMADALFDARVADAFARYKKESSRIVSGSLDFPETHPHQEGETSPTVMDMPAGGKPLLEEEKIRMTSLPVFFVDWEGHSDRPLTGSIVAGYFRHHQCPRFVRLHFVPPHLQPAASSLGIIDGRNNRAKEGLAFEETAVNHLRRMGAQVVSIPGRDSTGNIRSAEQRRSETIAELKKFCRLAEQGDPTPRYLTGGVLLSHHALFLDVGAMGVPDLIRISGEKAQVNLEVGEIKASLSPRFHHKWQVAFYAFLLEQTIRNAGFSKPGLGFGKRILSAPLLKRGRCPWRNISFDLPPYLAAFPTLIRNLEDILSHNARKAGFHLRQPLHPLPMV